MYIRCIIVKIDYFARIITDEFGLAVDEVNLGLVQVVPVDPVQLSDVLIAPILIGPETKVLSS
jgi:hypothetical protein